MGITIHYRLGAQDGKAVERTLDLAELTARKLGMKAERREPKWLVVWPHPDAETLEFRFQYNKAKATEENLWGRIKELGPEEFEKLARELDDPLADKWVCSGSCKTQFAGADTHILVAELVRLVASFCSYVDVCDEGDYYETRNPVQAAKAIDESDTFIRAIAKQFQKAGFRVVVGNSNKSGSPTEA
jgi:hypothetical protein